MKKPQPKIMLSLSDRITLPGILKGKDDYQGLLTNKKIGDKVAFTPKEEKDFEIVSSNVGQGQMIFQYNKKGQANKTLIEFSEMEKMSIKLALKELNDKKELQPQHINLYETFVVNG